MSRVVMIDTQKAIRMVVESGKVEFGARSGKVYTLKGGAKLILMSNNCPKALKAEMEYYSKKSGVPLHEVDLTSIELGSACGKPFPISFLSDIYPGNSAIKKLTEEK
jgi:large subunit ribosomal protein L30e